MKKNKGLVIGLLIVLVLIAVAAWYFFFRTNANKLATEGGATPSPGATGSNGGPLEKLCPSGTSGTYPDCTLDTENPDTIFSNGIEVAKQRVTNNATITVTQKANAIAILNKKNNILTGAVSPDVINKAEILQDAASGKDIVELILIALQKIYFAKYGVGLQLAASEAVRGRG